MEVLKQFGKIVYVMSCYEDEGFAGQSHDKENGQMNHNAGGIQSDHSMLPLQ